MWGNDDPPPPISRTEIRKHLETVLSSAALRGSAKYEKLLRYLVERSLADETPHEIDIAVDVFGKDENYDTAESSSIRGYVFQLRKKLEDYYAGLETEPAVHLRIPKGSYRIVFGSPLLPAAEAGSNAARSRPARTMRIAFASVAALLVLSLAANVGLLGKLDRAGAAQPSAPATFPDFAWEDLAEGDEPILIALGDFFFFTDSATYPGRTHFIRDIGVNSAEDLERVSADAYGPSTRASSMTYLPKATAFALQSILPFASQTGKPVTLKLMSEVTGEDLRQNDVIYVGFVRSMGALQDYFFRLSNFSSQPPYARLNDKRTGESYASSGDVYGQTEDYGLFSKMPGPGDGEIHVFTGIHDIGILHAVRAVTDPNRARELQAGLDESTSAVEILFRVSGYNRTDLEATIAMTSLEPTPGPNPQE